MEKAIWKKYPFDYNKHILIKTIIGTHYRSYTSYKGLFQGVSVCRCDTCMVEGYDRLSHPFKIEDLDDEEIHCNMYRMGIKEIDPKYMDLMPMLEEYFGQMLCPQCIEEKDEADMIPLLDPNEIIQNMKEDVKNDNGEL